MRQGSSVPCLGPKFVSNVPARSSAFRRVARCTWEWQYAPGRERVRNSCFTLPFTAYSNVSHTTFCQPGESAAEQVNMRWLVAILVLLGVLFLIGYFRID